MNQLIIFSVTALVCTIPLVLFNNYYLRRTFLAYVGLVMIILVCMISIMTFCIATLGMHHLIWALPLCASFVIISLMKIIKKVRKPIFEIYNTLEALANGDVDLEIDEHVKAQRNEIGKVYRSLDKYVRKQKAVAAFATEVGAGNLQVQYEVSSDQDKIGLALIKMRSNLENFIGSAKDVVKTASQEGNLDVRIATENQEGAWRDLGFALNDLLDSFSQPLLNVNEIISSMAQGDMTQRYTAPAKGDILRMAENLNAALDNIDGLLAMVANNVRTIDASSREMKTSSEEMSASTQEIATSIAEMSNGAQIQVTKVDESSRLIEGILSSSHSMGTKAENINQTAVQGEKISEKGLKLMNGMVDDIGQISFYAKNANESIQVLKDRSAQISNALSVISEIASQTNLLALNAAIEAAQAGDAGRGFSVVAEEIRKLAEGSKRSANEIGRLVQDVQSDTLSAAKSMSEMVSCVTRGENTSQETSVAFNQILASSNETLKLSEEILTATREQIKDINEVVTITEKIVVIAEQTAAGSEEVASSATELSTGMEAYNQRAQNLAQMAVSFRDAVSQLKLSDGSKEVNEDQKTVTE